MPRGLRVLLTVGALPHRRRRLPVPRPRRGARRRATRRATPAPRSSASSSRCAGPRSACLRKVIDAVDAVHRETGPRSRVLARAPHAAAGAASRGCGCAPLQPQPRDVPRGVPAHLHHAHLRRPRRAPHASPSTPAWSCAAAASSAWARRWSSASTSRSSSPRSKPCEVPVNLLDPRPGTPLADTTLLSPREALQAIALFRLVMPSAWIRLAGGRERVLGELQAHGAARGRQRARSSATTSPPSAVRPPTISRCSTRSACPWPTGRAKAGSSSTPTARTSRPAGPHHHPRPVALTHRRGEQRDEWSE